MTAEVASEAATETNSLMISLSVTGGEEFAIIFVGARRTRRPVLTRRCRCTEPPPPPPLQAPVLIEWIERTLLLGGAWVRPLIAEEDDDKHWKRRARRPTPLPLPLPRLPSPRFSPIPSPSLLRDDGWCARETAAPAEEDGSGLWCSVPVARAAALVEAVVTTPPRQEEASATADKTGVARMVEMNGGTLVRRLKFPAVWHRGGERWCKKANPVISSSRVTPADISETCPHRKACEHWPQNRRDRNTHDTHAPREGQASTHVLVP